MVAGIHDYFKFLKFGFGRASDLACLHIRRGRLTRQDGLEVWVEASAKSVLDDQGRLRKHVCIFADGMRLQHGAALAHRINRDS